MYYLLDNNLIINKNDKRFKKTTYSIDKTQTFVYLECDSKNPEAIFNCQESYYATRHLVIKQSKNVFDLIEVGDLVKHLYDLETNTYTITQIMLIENGLLKIDNIFYIDRNDVIAIYKPNSKGDYIKVWEVVVDDK